MADSAVDWEAAEKAEAGSAEEETAAEEELRMRGRIEEDALSGDGSSRRDHESA